MWFLFVVAHNCCWTADHLAKRGLPKPKESPLCDQEEEKYQSPPYFLCLCWTILVYLWSLVGESMKQPVVWSNVGSTLWSYWALGSYGTTNFFFYGMTPSVSQALIMAGEECQLWSTAGAKGISFLTAPMAGSWAGFLRQVVLCPIFN